MVDTMRPAIRVRVLRIPPHDGPRIDACHYCLQLIELYGRCLMPAQGAVQRNGGDPNARLTWWCEEHLDAAAVRITIEANS